MNIRRIASEVYQAMWSRPQCTLPRARNMRQEDIDRIAKAIDDAVQEALNQPVLVSEWQEQQSELTQLREQNRVLEREYTRLFNLAKPIATLLQDLKIIPIGCSREQELAWKMAVKNFRHYQQGYEASVAIDAALTATSQPGGTHEL